MMQYETGAQQCISALVIGGWFAWEPDGGGSNDGNAPPLWNGWPDGKTSPTRVLIIDDEQLIADTLARILNLSGFAAHAVYNGDDALHSLDWHCPDILLTDVRMPGRNGIETAISIRAQCPDIRVVLFSGQAGSAELIERAKQDGHGFELWSKPIHPRELIRRLQAL